MTAKLVDLKTPATPTTPAESEPAAVEATPNPAEAVEELSFMDDINANFDLDEGDTPAPVEEVIEQVVQSPQPAQAQPAVVPPTPAAPPSAVPPQQAAPVAPQPGQQPQAPVAPAAQPAPVAQPVVAAPAQVPPQAPQVQPQPQQQPAVPANPLQALKEGLEQQREAFVQSAAQTYVNTFSDDDISALQGGEPAQAKQVVGTMAARLHADIVQNVLGIVAQQVPLMVQRAQVVYSQQQQASDQFYSQYPDLKDHMPTVNNLAAGLRQAHPNMPQEQFIPLLVASARGATGSFAPPPVQQPQQVPQPRQQPAFQPVAARPAPRGNGAQPVARQGETNWAFMDEIIQAEDSGRFEPR